MRLARDTCTKNIQLNISILQKTAVEDIQKNIGLCIMRAANTLFTYVHQARALILTTSTGLLLSSPTLIICIEVDTDAIFSIVTHRVLNYSG